MPPEESRYSDDWLRIAEKDMRRVERSLRAEDPELAGFCLQQAVEQFRGTCQTVTKYYTLERYPLAVGSGLTEGEVQSSLEAVRGLVEQVRDQGR